MEELLGFLLLVGTLVLGPFVIAGAVLGLERFETWLAQRNEMRVARIEAELDRTQAELRTTILSLADALGAEAHEARRELIRESYRASGHVPEQQ